MSSEKKRKVPHLRQRMYLENPMPQTAYIAPRGNGKGTLLGFDFARLANSLPGGKTFLGNQTFYALLNRTLPEVYEVWDELGLVEWTPKTKNAHYIVGRKPPLSWAKPIKRILDPEHAIFFNNGFVIELLSQMNNHRDRGGNYLLGRFDEAGFLKRSFVEEIALVAIRGWKDILVPAGPYKGKTFGQTPFYNQLALFTSPPVSQEGGWIYDYEKLMLEELAAIKRGELKVEQMQNLFLQGHWRDNIEALGEQYYKNLKAKMLPQRYRIEVEGERIGKLPFGFYPAFSEERHVRKDMFETGYNTETGHMFIKADTFLDRKLPLDISLDFNAAFTSATVWQVVDVGPWQEVRCDSALYIKPGYSQDSLSEQIVDKFCESYGQHPIKHVNLYGDRNGHSRSAMSMQTAYQLIEERFRKNGWSTSMHVVSDDWDHQMRHEYINEILKEQRPGWPRLRVHSERARDLIISIQNTPILPGFKKDKGSEKREIPQEEATHLSDTFDNYLTRRFPNLLTGGGGELFFI